MENDAVKRTVYQWHTPYQVTLGDTYAKFLNGLKEKKIINMKVEYQVFFLNLSKLFLNRKQKTGGNNYSIAVLISQQTFSCK